MVYFLTFFVTILSTYLHKQADLSEFIMNSPTHLHSVFGLLSLEISLQIAYNGQISSRQGPKIKIDYQLGLILVQFPKFINDCTVYI